MKYKVSGSLCCALAAVVLSSTAALAATRTFEIGDKMKRDVVSFTSDAPVELIVGKTSSITGKVTMDDSLDLTKPVQANFDVDLASIDTGIPLRNEHMRDNFLETKKYPAATFVLKKLDNPPTQLKENQTVKLSGVGDFTVHGKTVSKKVTVEVTLSKKCPQTEANAPTSPAKAPGCDLLHIKTTFPVVFADHSIQRPQIVFQKLADTVFVTVAATAHAKAASK